MKNKPDGLFFNRQFCAETPNCCDRRGKITYVIFPRGLSVKRFGMEVNMDFKAFDTSRLDEYAEQARKQWGQTAAWQEFKEKSRGRNGEAEKAVAAGLMLILEEIGKQKSQGLSAKAPSVQDLVKTAAELHHGALLSVYAGNSVRTGKNVRRRRRFYGEYRPGLRRGNGCVRGGGDCGLL